MDFDDIEDFFEDIFDKRNKRKKKQKKKRKRESRSFFERLFDAIAAFFSGNKQLPDGKQKEKWEDDRRRNENRPKASPKFHQQKPQQPSRTHQALQQAYDYRQRIEAMALAADADSVERMRLDLLSSRVSEWTLAIEEIVEKQLITDEDDLIQTERKRVPEAIKRLEKELKSAKDPQLQQKLKKTLANRQAQLAQFEQIENQKRIAELKVENTLAQLGIIYAQLQSGQFMRNQNNYERLSAEVRDEVHELEDYLSAWQDLRDSNANRLS